MSWTVSLSSCSFTRSFGVDNLCYCIHKKKFTGLNWSYIEGVKKLQAESKRELKTWQVSIYY